MASSFEDAVAAARAAKSDRRFDDALEAWAKLRAQYPRRPIGYLGAIKTARAAGKRRLAEQLIAEGVQHFPNAGSLARLAEQLDARDNPSADPLADAPADPAEALEAALAPTRRRKPRPPALNKALARVEVLETRFPGRPDVRLACIRLLRALKRLPEARQRGETWLAEAPDDVSLGVTLAEVLDDMGDLPAAGALLSGLHERLGSHPLVAAAYLSVLSRQGDPRVDAICAEALAAHPRSPAVMREYAALAQRQGDWQEALRRWELAKASAPSNGKIELGLRACRLQLAISNTTSDTELVAFFGRFESLGGTLGGCEFGMVQRNHGSAALGLLRWSNIRAHDLIAGLHNQFAGLGTLENTELRTHRVSADREEYVVYDKNFRLGSHTFISTKEAPHDKMLVQTARRLAYLKDALLDQLCKAEKIFIYKFQETPPGTETIMREISAAMRQYGPTTLLCAVQSGVPALRGTIRKLDDGLYVGHVSHFMGHGATSNANFDVPAWTGICSAVLADQNGNALP